MKRLCDIALLLVALLGLMGQSVAMARMPTQVVSQSMKTLMVGMDCMAVMDAPVRGTSPCEKMTMQCMVAMGCVPLAMVEPVEGKTFLVAIEPVEPVLRPVARLCGRSYGPEPDPPSFLI